MSRRPLVSTLTSQFAAAFCKSNARRLPLSPPAIIVQAAPPQALVRRSGSQPAGDVPMIRPLVRSTLLAALFATGAAHAGTVYVPSPGLGSIGGSAYEVQVAISNTAAAP